MTNEDYRSDVKFPDVHVKLTGHDSNGAYIIGRVAKALRNAGHHEGADAFVREAMAGDYTALLGLATRTVEVS